MMWHPQRPTYPRTVVEKAIDTFRSTAHLPQRGFGLPDPSHFQSPIVNLVGINPVPVSNLFYTRCMVMIWQGGLFNGIYSSQIIAPHPWHILVEEDDWL